MNPDCKRWAELADLDALGEPVPDAGRAFQRAHEATCADCGHEAAIWRATQVPESDLHINDAEVEKILFLAAADRARRASSLQRRNAALYFVAGAVACAAAVFLWLSARSPHSPQAQNQRPVHTPLVASASQAPTRAPAEPPVEAIAEARCSQVVPGATVCLASGAVLGRRALSGPQRELEVSKGRAVVSLAPQAPGTSFSLTTAAGKVTAVGTIFSVDVNADGATVARVIEGKVLVQATSEDTAHPVHAGQAFRLGQQQATALLDPDRDLDLALLSMDGPNERDAASSPSAAKPTFRGADSARPRDMLEYARSLRASGDTRGAADVYRKIHANNPESPSGRAALVSLGELLLSLGDAQGALSAFDSYLAGSGALSQEAMFGRVRALRALNHTLEEQQAIQRFVAAYPDVPQSRVLRARLAAIQK
jgi:ferric-dicitrate binding protein FerR (iron transport regulator)